MMDHTEVRRHLSSYLDGEVSGEERSEIEAHLADCPRCREALAELTRTIGRIRDLPRVEPPPWLAAKTMARVREAAEPRPSLWRRLFFPLSVKLPLEAVALVLLCVTGYYLARTMAPQLPIVAPGPAPQEQARPAPSGETSPPSPAPQPKAAPPRPASRPAAPPSEGRREVPAPSAPLPAAPARPAPVEEFTPPPAGSPAPAARPAVPAMEKAAPLPRPAAPSFGVPPRAAEEQSLGGAPADGATPQKAVKRSKKAERAAAGGMPAPALPRLEAVLGVEDAAAAEAGVSEAVRRTGGTVLRREDTPAGLLLVVRVEGARLADLTTRLGRLGALRRRPEAEAAAVVELTIRIEENR